MNSSTERRHIGRVVKTVTALAILTAVLFLLAGCENKPSNSSVSTTPAPTSSTATPTPDNTNPDD
ncbi:MAG: hypothetical protein J6Y67_07795, partial [Lachnospiraceae bacterium]|nr:hypothetical protein [Lachnospiraceae bacterium]